MNSKTPSLKNIFSSFFFEYWEQIKFNFDEKRRKNIWKNVCAFLRCGNPKFGYAEYICPDCFEKLVVPFTCKSKFCPSCGIVYAEKWAHSLHEQLFNVHSIYISLFLFLLVLSGIFSFFSNLNFVNLLMLHILLSNILLKKLVYIKLESLLISILLLEIHHGIHIFMLLLLMVDLILIIIGKHQNLFRGLSLENLGKNVL